VTRLVFFFSIMTMAATLSGAGERIQLVGTIKGAGCTHFQAECVNDDNYESGLPL
jgi:hypothetical protein